MEAIQTIVHSVLIPLAGKRLMLPNASVAELISYRPTEAVENTPDWLLGLVDWRGYRIPVISMETLLGSGNTPIEGRARLVIFNALGGDPRLPFFATVSQGIPHLAQANASVVTSSPDEGDQPGVCARVLYHGEPALIPDLDAIERMIKDVPGALVANPNLQSVK